LLSLSLPSQKLPCQALSRQTGNRNDTHRPSNRLGASRRLVPPSLKPCMLQSTTVSLPLPLRSSRRQQLWGDQCHARETFHNDGSGGLQLAHGRCRHIVVITPPAGLVCFPPSCRNAHATASATFADAAGPEMIWIDHATDVIVRGGTHQECKGLIPAQSRLAYPIILARRLRWIVANLPQDVACNSALSFVCHGTRQTRRETDGIWALQRIRTELIIGKQAVIVCWPARRKIGHKGRYMSGAGRW